MPSKSRWKLNPRKWFGAIVNAAHKRNIENKAYIDNFIIPIPTLSRGPHLSTTRNRITVLPVSTINNKHSINALSCTAQLQSTEINKRPERISTAISNPKISLTPTRLEPSIRKKGPITVPISINTTRLNIQITGQSLSNTFVSSTSSPPNENIIPSKNLPEKQSEINISTVSDRCLIDYPQNISNDLMKRCSSSMGTRSRSSIDDQDDSHESSSSGIFSEGRTDSNHQHRVISRDQLSKIEVLSIESLADSQTSFDHDQPRTSTQYHRLSISTADDKSEQQIEQQSPALRIQRAFSAEHILQNKQITRPMTAKSRQSTAAIVKKIEKRIPTNRSPVTTFEKASFVRVAIDTYRLTNDKDENLNQHHQQRPNSIIEYSTHEEALPSANDEECYAQLPRTSSTEQLDNNLQNNLRAIVDDCLRPIVSALNKSPDRSIIHQSRSKRPYTKHEQTEIIEDITDKLLSSMDCSLYAQYQRCY